MIHRSILESTFALGYLVTFSVYELSKTSDKGYGMGQRGLD